MTDEAKSGLLGRLREGRSEVGGWYDIVRSGGVKFIVLGFSAVLGIVISRLIITTYGTDVYAQYGLLVGLGALLSANALGVGAPVINTVASSDQPSSDDHLRQVLLSSLRVMAVSAVVLILIVVAISGFGWWEAVLGEGLLPGTGPLAAAACIIFWALTIPAGMGQRVLAGLGKNHIVVATAGLQSPLVLLVLLVTLDARSENGAFIPVVAYIATFLIAILCWIWAARLIRPTLSTAAKQLLARKRFPGARIKHEALPLTIIVISLLLAMQTDRIILSHVADVEALAQYNLAAQMFTPITALASAAGFTLWPRFAAARARNKSESPMRLVGVFGLLGAGLALGVAILSPLLASFASDGSITLGWTLILAFSVLATLQATQYPMSMYLTDAAGLRFQAFMLVLLVPMNVGISWLLAQKLGASGPVIGSVITIFLLQIVANIIYIRYRLRAVADDTHSDTQPMTGQ